MAESNIVDRHIRNLRVKLQNHSRRPRYIATFPGRGYRFLPTAGGDFVWFQALTGYGTNVTKIHDVPKESE